MADEPQDVPAAPSPAPMDVAPDPSPAPAPVTADVDAVVDDRPLKNLQSEWNRKFGKVEQALSDIASRLQTYSPPAPAAPAAAQGWDAYTDEQLAQLAQAGSAEAAVKLSERVTTRIVQQHAVKQGRTQAVVLQLNGLFAKYPQLRDTMSPLYQAAMRAKEVLLQTGMYVQGTEVDVQAIYMAIAEHPEHVRPAEPPAEDTVRRVAAQNPARMDGSVPRKTSPAPRAQAEPLSQKERDIARRMGVKDPANARGRFYERQLQGRSSVSPMVATIVREEA